MFNKSNSKRKEIKMFNKLFNFTDPKSSLRLKLSLLKL